MKRITFILLGLLGIFLLYPVNSYAAPDGSCEPWERYLTGEMNGVKFDMANIYKDPNIDDKTKKEYFIAACKKAPLRCAKEEMKYHLVDAVCSNAIDLSKYLIAGYISNIDTLIPKKTSSSEMDFEDYRVSIGGFIAYVGRKEILNYAMNDVPASSSFKRATMGDKMPGDRDYKTTIDMTLYDVAMNGRKLDDVENPVAKPFITFIQAEKKKWDAQQNFAAKMHDDLVKAAKGGKMAIDNYTGKNLALDGKTYNEINKLLKLNRI